MKLLNLLDQKNLPGKRLKFNTRKRAKQAAQRASKGKKPRHDSKSRIRNPHFHPETKNEHRITPKGHGNHDHYYYPKRRY